MKHGPTNSLGKPWAGETWSCDRCGDTGPDRDDVAHGGCKAHPSRVSWAPHVLRFHPQEHHDTLVALGVL
jgi:hypothetical protein